MGAFVQTGISPTVGLGFGQNKIVVLAEPESNERTLRIQN